MKIKVLGTRGEIDPILPYHRNHSGILIDDTLMFDLGEKKFLQYTPKYIFLTHLHPDHAYFVRERENVPVKIYAPEGYQGMENVEAISSPVTLDSYKITPVPSHHAKIAKSQAYVIAHEGEKILYTGDVVWIDKEYHPIFQGVNLVITDGSFMRRGGRITRDKETGRIFGHAGIPDLIRLFKDYTRHILFVHFGSWFYDDTKEARRKLTALGKENGVDIITGYDGMELEVGSLK